MSNLGRYLEKAGVLPDFVAEIGQQLDLGAQGRTHRKRLVIKYVREYAPNSFSGSDDEDAWQIAREFACEQCVRMLANPPVEWFAEIGQLQQEVREGRASPAALAISLARNALESFWRSISEIYSDFGERDLDFKELQEALVSRGQDVFVTEQRRVGVRASTCYAPAGVELHACAFTWENMEIPPAALGAVRQDIRKGGNRGGSYSMVWNRPVVEEEALRFWDAFISCHNDGKPCLVPLYALYSWCHQSLDLGRQQTVSLNSPLERKDGNDADVTLETLIAADQASPEKSLDMKELNGLARTFVQGLSSDQRAFFWLYDHYKGRQRDIAIRMGKPDDRISRLKTATMNRLFEFITRDAKLMLDDDEELNFLDQVIGECKKMAPATIWQERS